MSNIYDWLKNNLSSKKDLVIFELGACDGIDTKKILDILDVKKYLAFEPDPRNIKSFRENILDNRVRLYPIAISNFNGESYLNLSSGCPSGQEGVINTRCSSLKEPHLNVRIRPWIKFKKRARVEVRTLDLFCKDFYNGKIDFMWVDIQGSEKEMIQGGQKTLLLTKYLYMEHVGKEMYKEQETDLNRQLERLPGFWSLIKKWSDDVLLKNNAIE